jgi:hypothetical protein
MQTWFSCSNPRTLKFRPAQFNDGESAVKLWNIFGFHASTDMGEVINKIDDSTFLRSDGTVYRQEGHLITGSDGSVLSVLDTDPHASSGHTGMAVTTYAGSRSSLDDDW